MTRNRMAVTRIGVTPNWRIKGLTKASWGTENVYHFYRGGKTRFVDEIVGDRGQKKLTVESEHLLFRLFLLNLDRGRVLYLKTRWLDDEKLQSHYSFSILNNFWWIQDFVEKFRRRKIWTQFLFTTAKPQDILRMQAQPIFDLLPWKCWPNCRRLNQLQLFANLVP